MPALAEQTTEELRNGPAYAEVLDIGNDANAPVAMAVGPAAAAAAAAAPGRAQTTTASAKQAAAKTNLAAGQQSTAQSSSPQQQGIRPSQWTEPKAPNTIIVSDEKRMVGLQYVIIQSYPEEEKALAESAMQTLNQHGVLCTVERGLPYAPTLVLRRRHHRLRPLEGRPGVRSVRRAHPADQRPVRRHEQVQKVRTQAVPLAGNEGDDANQTRRKPATTAATTGSAAANPARPSSDQRRGRHANHSAGPCNWMLLSM